MKGSPLPEDARERAARVREKFGELARLCQDLYDVYGITTYVENKGTGTSMFHGQSGIAPELKIIYQERL